MYAIIRTGGKQYRVEEGETLAVEKIAAENGSQIEISDVLLVANDKELKVTKADLEGALVKATVVDQVREKKIIVFKKKRRQGYSKKRGHRQDASVIRIDKIEA